MNKTTRTTLALLAGSLTLGLAACGSDDSSSSATAAADSSTAAKSSGSINGAGFPQPVYTEWAARLKDASGLTVNYQGIGSGGGVAQFTAGTVDFGASDAALKDEEVAAASKKSDALDIPTVFGAVTISYNVSGVDTGLKLDGQTAANIFKGKVKTWDDPAIADQNSGVDLPDTAITVCHRSDESGTTKLFTTFLGAYDKSWEKEVGIDKTVKWPGGTGAKGNDGVAACVKQNDGAIGYVEAAYALQNDFTFADVKNKAGNYVAPTLESTSAAGDGLTVPDDLRFDAIDAPGDQAYPIASSTFLLVHQDLCAAGLSEDKAKDVKIWLDYALGDGQQVASELEYAPLPDSILEKAKAKVASLTCNGSPLS